MLFRSFHSGEERGGIGSSALAAASGDWLRANFDRAIAIDRRGTRDIITHQAGGRCCSDAFARALAAALTLGHAPSSAGIYTDTAEYVDHIGECTNISAGYTREHTQAETVDVGYVLRLTAALLATDVESLPTVRVPGEWEPTYSTSYTARGRRTWSGHWWPDEATGGLSADIDELTGDYIARDDGRIVPFTRRRRPEIGRAHV